MQHGLMSACSGHIVEYVLLQLFSDRAQHSRYNVPNAFYHRQH